jgi:hypothetical protein
MPQQLRSVGAASCAKIFAVLYGIFGILMGIVFCLIFLLGALAGSPGLPERRGAVGFLLGVGSIIFFPIFYALIGAVGGLIGAALYNFVAKHMGGIEIELG